MHASLQSAHDAYRHAAELRPPPTPPAPVMRPEPIDVEWRFVPDRYEITGGDLVAVLGGAICLFAGAAFGAWLQVPL